VAQTQFTSGSVAIVADDLVVEVFDSGRIGSFRLPSAWVGVHVKPGRHDEVEVKFGIADEPSGPTYGEDVTVYDVRVAFQLPAADEPALRTFFADVARRAGRTS
jgi:hypothetical protein